MKIKAWLQVTRDFTVGYCAALGVAELFHVTLHDFLWVLLWSTVGVAVAYPVWCFLRVIGKYPDDEGGE